MTKEELINHTKSIIAEIDQNYHGARAQAIEFLKSYAGPDNDFLRSIRTNYTTTASGHQLRLRGILESFIKYVKNDLLREISLEREIQIDTVSDYLGQAELLLMDKKVHPVAPAVIIGASLEEFLRNWLEEKGSDMSQVKPSIDSYSKELKRLGAISKQDIKDITSWAGTRNDAAHGQWESVSDKNRIRLMLEGVNLFMRKYS